MGAEQVRQGQGVTKAKGERQLEPRHVGPGTGKVMPQMPGYLAHHVTLPPQTASRACQWSIRPTYERDVRCWHGIGDRVGRAPRTTTSIKCCARAKPTAASVTGVGGRRRLWRHCGPHAADSRARSGIHGPSLPFVLHITPALCGCSGRYRLEPHAVQKKKGMHIMMIEE